MTNTFFGIDISCYTAITDWKKLAEHISFAYVKASQGRLEKETAKEYSPFVDKMAHTHIVNASKHLYLTGAYHYLTATTVVEARAEAKFFINFLNNHRGYLNLDPVVDVESLHLPKSVTAVTNIVNNFIDVLKSNGYDCAVYSTPLWFGTVLSGLKPCKKWVAKWSAYMPTRDADTYMWQSGTMNIPGINGAVDVDFMWLG